jgi:hypothetical protein
MNSADINPFPIDSYFSLLKNLSEDDKLELIALLSDSVQKRKKPTKRAIHSLFGALKTRQSADKFIFEIKKSRTFKRKPAKW